jgi:hypothetical protein
MSHLKIKITSKNLGRQRYAEGFNSGVKRLTNLILDGRRHVARMEKIG